MGTPGLRVVDNRRCSTPNVGHALSRTEAIPKGVRSLDPPFTPGDAHEVSQLVAMSN